MDLTLCLTHDCNLDCAYCYAGGKRRVTMSRETAEAAVDLAIARSRDEMQIGFFGGEPLLEWDRLRHATEYAEKKAADADVTLKKTVTTNATLVTPERARWLKAHGFYPALSIDGNRAMHEATRPLRGGASSFDACMAGLDATQAEFPSAEVITVPDPQNVCHLAEGVRYLAEERNVLRVSINPNFYAEWDDAALATWRAQYEAVGDFALERYRASRAVAINVIDGKIITRLKNGFECRDRCGFGEGEIAVAASGNIYPCERVVGDDDNEALRIGDVRSGFDEKRRQAILRKRGNVNPECADCAIRHRCMNWCCCINYALTGEIDRTDGVVCFHEQLSVAVADRVASALYAEDNPLFLARFYYEDFADAEVEDNTATPPE